MGVRIPPLLLYKLAVGVRFSPGLLEKTGYIALTQRKRRISTHISEDPANACENVFFSLDENGEPDVREVVIRAGNRDELSMKLEKAKELSPNTIVLNGTIRDFDFVYEQVFDSQ